MPAALNCGRGESAVPCTAVDFLVVDRHQDDLEGAIASPANAVGMWILLDGRATTRGDAYS